MPPRDVTFTETLDDNIHRIEGKNNILAFVLDLLICPNPPVLADVMVWGSSAGMATLKDIIRLGERYQFDSLPRAVVPDLTSHVHIYPEWIFVFASQHDFSELAKRAVQRFDHCSQWSTQTWKAQTIDNLNFDKIAAIPVRYYHALIKGMSVGSGYSTMSRVAWNVAATAFEEALKESRPADHFSRKRYGK